MISIQKTSEAALEESFSINNPSNLKKVKRIKELSEINRLPKAIIRIKNEQEDKKSFKMEEKFLKESLFAFFENTPECFIDEVQSYFDQPRGYLTRILEEICNKKKVSNRYVYSLKSIYKS